MKAIRNIPEFDVTVVTLDKIFEAVQVNTLNSVCFSSTKGNYKQFDSDCKKFFLHFLIKEICDRMRSIKFTNKILLITPDIQNIPYDIWNYLDPEVVMSFLVSSFQTLKNNFPFPVYVLPEHIDIENRTGETVDLLNILSLKVHEHSMKPISLKKLKSFSKKNGLAYLANTYYISSEFQKLFYSTK